MLKTMFIFLQILVSLPAFAAELYFMPQIGDRTLYRYDIQNDEVTPVARFSCSPSDVIALCYDAPRNEVLALVHHWIVRIKVDTGATLCTAFKEVSSFDGQPIVNPQTGVLFTPALFQGKMGVWGVVILPNQDHIQNAIFNETFWADRACFDEKSENILYWSRGAIKRWSWNTGGIDTYQPNPQDIQTGVATYIGIHNSQTLLHTIEFCDPGYGKGRLESTAGGGFTLLTRGLDGEAVPGTPGGTRFVVFNPKSNVFYIYDFETGHISQVDVAKTMLADHPEYRDEEIPGLLDSVKRTYHTPDGRYLVLARNTGARAQASFAVYDLDEQRWSRLIPIGNGDVGGVGGFVAWVPERAEGTSTL